MRTKTGDLTNVRSIEGKLSDGTEEHHVIIKGEDRDIQIPASEENADMLEWAARRMRRDEEDDDE